MTILSRFLGWAWKLPPVETRDIQLDRDVQVPMPDGAVLLADHYHPRGPDRRPTILIRSPYGRALPFGLLFGRPLAEQGFQVLIQSCRGTFGSTGTFRAFHDERADGLATLDWIEKQPWFSGKLATFGPSYLGVVQWAIASEAGSRISAMAGQITTSSVRDSMYSGGPFWLDTALSWACVVTHQEKGLLRAFLALRRAPQQLARAAGHLPLQTADEAMIGKPAPYYREWLDHGEPGDPFWAPIDWSATVPAVTAPVQLLGGWYDVFSPQLLADYQRLRAAGREPHLIVGPWQHGHKDVLGVALAESIAWFRAHLLGDRSGLRALPVRLFVMGADEWRDYPSFPPPGMRQERWFLQPEGGLSTAPPPESEPDRYRYDPADPTPGIGGAALSVNSGPKDNAPLLARADVLAYTSPPLERALEIIGPVSAELFVESSLDHTDFFVRLCDTAPSGKTINLCDGILRLTPESPPRDERGRRRITVDLWPTAHRFAAGHRVRVLVSSGAHPRFARNPGSGEPAATATTLRVSDQAVLHGPACPSAIVLPVVPA
jgi:putative CocE/NonD family hydrolase